MNTSLSLAPHSLKVCRGVTSCAHAVMATHLGPELEARIAASRWPQLFASLSNAEQHHTRFKMALAACPNGCSQPQIVDFGLIATARIAFDPERCTACGLCIPHCAEKALHLDGHIHLDASRCLGCTACVRACPTAALEVSALGYRVLLGGKLGRHPHLAHELGWYTQEHALDLLTRTLDMLCARFRPGLRVKDILCEMGQDILR